MLFYKNGMDIIAALRSPQGILVLFHVTNRICFSNHLLRKYSIYFDLADVLSTKYASTNGIKCVLSFKKRRKRSLTIIQKKKKKIYETYDPDQHHKQQQQFGKRIDLTVFVMLNDHLFPSLLYFQRLTLFSFIFYNNSNNKRSSCCNWKMRTPHGTIPQ